MKAISFCLRFAAEAPFVFLAPSFVALAALLAFAISREHRLAEETQILELKENAAAIYEQVAAPRLRGERHGGVRAERESRTPPNPTKSHIGPEDQRRLAKNNPSPLARQSSGTGRGTHGYRLRVVGLRAENPVNAPDAWEKAVLLQRAGTSPGTSPATSVEEGVDGRFFRYLVPLQLEAPCLTCHAKGGWRQGDIMGSVSIGISMGGFDNIRKAGMRDAVLSLLAYGGAGMVAAFVITLYFSRRFAREIKKNIEREKLAAVAELAGATAHEMRQPMTVVNCILDIAWGASAQDTVTLTGEERRILLSQCVRMNDFIERLPRVTQYKTRDYAAGLRILDVEASLKGGSQEDQ